MAVQQSQTKTPTFLLVLLCMIAFVVVTLIFYNQFNVSHSWSRSHLVSNRNILRGNAISAQLDYMPKLPKFCKDFQNYSQSRKVRREYIENIHSSLIDFNVAIEMNRATVLNSSSFLNSTYDFNRYKDSRRYIQENNYAGFMEELKNETWIKITHFMHKLNPQTSETDVVSQSLRNPMFHIYLDKPAYNWQVRHHDFAATPDLNLSLCPIPLNSVHARKVHDAFRLRSRIFLLTIPHGSVSMLGHVWSRDVYIMSAGCPLDQAKNGRRMGPLGIYTPRYDEVFVMSQWWSRAFYHFNVETFPRIIPYLMFLKRNPTVQIHMPHDRANHLRPHLAIIGINASRIIWGDVKAKLIYLPQGGGCLHLANPISLQLTSNFYLNHLSQTFIRSRSPRKSVVLIQRSGERKLLQHTDVVKALERVAARANKELVVYSDDPMPTLQMTQMIFYNAAVIIGSHGAGISNMVWAPPPTTVIEVRCATIIPCFALNAQSLGHRYYGIHPIGGGCKNGINVNVTHLASVVQFILDNSDLHH